MSKTRLKRLIESGLCESEDSKRHAGKLRSYLEQLDEESIKRQSYILKALADPTRIKILHLLKNRAMCTCEIMVALNLTEPNASHHLNLLERNEIVKSQRMGKWIFYKLQRSTIKEIMGSVSG